MNNPDRNPFENPKPNSSRNSRGKIIIIILALMLVIGGGLYFFGGGDLFQGKMVLKKTSNTETEKSKQSSDKASKKANEEKIKEENSKIAKKIMDQKREECQKSGGIWNESEEKCIKALGVRGNDENPAVEETEEVHEPLLEKFQSENLSDFGRIYMHIGNSTGSTQGGYPGKESVMLGSLTIWADVAPMSENLSELRTLTFKITGNGQRPDLLLTNIRMEDWSTRKTVATGTITSEGIIRFDFGELALPGPYEQRKNLSFLADIPQNAPEDVFSVNLYVNDSDSIKDFEFLSRDIVMDPIENTLIISEALDAEDGRINLPDNIYINDGPVLKNNNTDIYLLKITELEIIHY